MIIWKSILYLPPMIGKIINIDENSDKRFITKSIKSYFRDLGKLYDRG